MDNGWLSDKHRLYRYKNKNLNTVKAYLYHPKNYPVGLPGRNKKAIFLCAVGRIFFSRKPSKDEQLLARLPRRTHYKEENMDVKVPQRLDPQDIVKLLMALRRALKAQAI